MDKFREIDIEWDKANDEMYKPIRTMSSDEHGRKLVVQVLSDGIPIKTTSQKGGEEGTLVTKVTELDLYWETRDKKKLGLDSFTLVDAENAIYEMYFTTGLLSNIGELKSNLFLTDVKGSVTSNTFYIEVKEGIDWSATESSNSFSKLTKIMERIEPIIPEEEERVKVEKARVLAEQEREKKESVRIASEISRDEDEDKRLKNEANREDSEARRESSESDRLIAEAERLSAEEERVLNEASRESNESARITSEDKRALDESTRASNEDRRSYSESARSTSEDSRRLAETDRELEESKRKSSEIDRGKAEDDRISSEAMRKNKEIEREESETIRVISEDERILNESQRNLSEASREANESLRKTSESERVSNESYRIESEGVRVNLYNKVKAEHASGALKGDKGDPGEIENLTVDHIQKALGFTPKDYVAGANIDISGDTIGVTGQFGLTEEEVKKVKVDTAKDADTVGGHTVAKNVPADAKFTDTIVDISGKVDKATGKGLSTNDYTNEEKQKLKNVVLDLIAHNSDITTEEGAHGLRYWMDALEVKLDGVWVEIKTGGGGAGIKVGNVSFLSAEAELGNKISILWEDPGDVVFEGATLARWEGTQLRRKEGTYPQDEKDGILIVDNKVKNQYSEGYRDSGLVSGVEYYYSLFPYTDSGGITVDPANRVSAKAFLKYVREAPETPIVRDLILLKATVESDSGSVVSLDRVNWFTSPHTFEGLVEGKTYTPYSKIEETSDYFESSISEGNSFVAIAKSTQTAPSSPNISALDFDRVTITSVEGTEVRLNSSAWHDSPHTFTGLTEETAYTAYARRKETSTKLASPVSAGTPFTTPVEQQIYGFEIDESNTNPKTAVTYIGDAVGMTPASGNNGNFNWGSWEPFIKEISKPVVVKNGIEQYDLNYDNYNQKASGGDSNLTGTDGDVFTRFSHIHMKHTKINNGHKWEISDKPFPGSFSMTKDMENGYNQFNNPMLVTLQNLFILIFKDRDSQTALGRGRVDGSGYIASGNTNNKGFMFGSTQDLQVKFLGIEDFWGNKYQWVDGLVSDNSYNLLIGDKSFNDSGSGYSKQTTNISVNTSGYFRTTQGGKSGYAMADSPGSATTSYADYGHLINSRVAHFGGRQSGADSAGAFALRLLDTASASTATIAARLCYKNNDAFYVGSYLGYEQSGKLRSISGNLSQGNKTIGQFRTLAQENN